MTTATHTGTVAQATIHASSNVTYVSFKPEGAVVYLLPHAVDADVEDMATVRAQLSRRWAAEWDSPEDSIYDTFEIEED